MNKFRILDGEFSGQMIHEGVVVNFWATRNERGLSASFEQNPVGKQFSDYELFKALEAIIYGQE